MITAGSIEQQPTTRWVERPHAWWQAANYLSVGQNYLLHKLDMMLVTGPGHGAAGLNALVALERVPRVASRLAQ